MDWIEESPPRWDAAKQAIVAEAPAGVFEPGDYRVGQMPVGQWWRAEEAGEALGFGWIDVVAGDAQMLLAVHPDHRQRGVGSFILDRLEDEAARRGLNWLYNVVRPGHPERERVAAWLRERGFCGAVDDRLERRVARRR